jgi:hypothetical protein
MKQKYPPKAHWIYAEEKEQEIEWMIAEWKQKEAEK